MPESDHHPLKAPLIYVSKSLTCIAMIRSFSHKGLSELWSRGRTAKIDLNLHERILRRLDRLDVIARPEEMNLPGFDFHLLRGFKPTRYTVHVTVPGA